MESKYITTHERFPLTLLEKVLQPPTAPPSAFLYNELLDSPATSAEADEERCDDAMPVLT